MRILTAINVFDEVGPSRYKSNTISEWLSKPGQADGYRLMYDAKPRSKNLYLIDTTGYDGHFP